MSPKLTARLELRLSPEELARWQQAAEREQRPLSNLVRVAVDAWVNSTAQSTAPARKSTKRP